MLSKQLGHTGCSPLPKLAETRCPCALNCPLCITCILEPQYSIDIGKSPTDNFCRFCLLFTNSALHFCRVIFHSPTHTHNYMPVISTEQLLKPPKPKKPKGVLGTCAVENWPLFSTSTDTAESYVCQQFWTMSGQKKRVRLPIMRLKMVWHRNGLVGLLQRNQTTATT